MGQPGGSEGRELFLVWLPPCSAGGPAASCTGPRVWALVPGYRRAQAGYSPEGVAGPLASSSDALLIPSPLQAHDSDVNVISWNRLVSYMVASGADDGTLRIWDLRSFSQDSHVSHFAFHKGSVTSVEWCPYEGSMLASAGDDNQLAVSGKAGEGSGGMGGGEGGRTRGRCWHQRGMTTSWR